MQVEDILDDFGAKLKQDLQASLKKKGVMFGPQTSKLSARITHYSKETPDSVIFYLQMPDYAEYVDKGRGRSQRGGKGQVRKAIEDWVKRKGIVGKSELYKKSPAPASVKFNRVAKQLAFLIARKIHRHGFKGTHFYTDVIKDGRIKKLEKELSDRLKREVIINIS